MIIIPKFLIGNVGKWKQKVLIVQSCLTLLWPHGLYSPWNSPGQNTGVVSLSLLQGIFSTQRSNPGLLHCRQFLYQLSHQESQDMYGASNTTTFNRIFQRMWRQASPYLQGGRADSRSRKAKLIDTVWRQSDRILYCSSKGPYCFIQDFN